MLLAVAHRRIESHPRQPPSTLLSRASELAADRASREQSSRAERHSTRTRRTQLRFSSTAPHLARIAHCALSQTAVQLSRLAPRSDTQAKPSLRSTPAMSKKKKSTTRLSPVTLRKRVPSDGAGAAAASSLALSSSSSGAAVTPAPSSASSSSLGRRNPFGSRFLFLTVGTTRFDSLLTALNDRADELVAWLRAEGFSRALFQIGTGSVEPTAIQAAAARSSADDPLAGTAPLSIEWLRHSPDLLGFLSQADLVISHAGAGSILESLRLFRPLLVVINTSLMHNHQSEVAVALERGRYLYQTEPSRVIEFLTQANWSMPIEATARTASQGGSSGVVGGEITGAVAGTATNTKHQQPAVPRYQLLRYPPVQSDAFPQLLEEHVAQVLRPSSPTAHLRPLLITVVIPALLALAITWMIA